ncbi:NUDIX hydrolase [Novosphingobium colocasiae]|uniref:NUDIX hydrolase n=2 Tax=Novosphingobium colocasiae TaxID=1256513 RepID=A0A918PMJ1_9SPHN|nr:NUDIX hydrolase [Novosphingobium colocasiae]
MAGRVRQDGAIMPLAPASAPSTSPSAGPLRLEGTNVVPAATVVVFRRAANGGPPELLMLQRSGKMRFAAQALVFPGGRIDPADRSLAALLMPDADPELAAARVAAVRETLEEAGLLIGARAKLDKATVAAARAMLIERGELAPVLDHFGIELMPQAFPLFAHWCPLWDRAFDTRFFLYDMGTGAVELTVDETENTHLFWTSAANALAAVANGSAHAIFPTLRNLERLAQYPDFAAAVDDIARRTVKRIHPRRVTIDGIEYREIDDTQGYPVVREPIPEDELRG